MTYLKYLLYTVSAIFLLSLGALVYMFLRLPSPSEIAQKLPITKSQPKTAITTTAPDQQQVATATSELDDLRGKIRTEKDLTPEEQKQFDALMGEEIFDYSKPISETCDNLSKAPSSEFLEKDFVDSFTKTFGTDVSDPFLQAFLAPLKKATRFPKMKSFFEEVSLYKDQNKEASILDKGHFYLRALDAVREIRSRKEELNVASDRAYRMFVLAKAVQKKPELVQDSSVMDFCYQLQNTIENTKDVDRDQENAEFLKFLNYAGIDSNEVGYNPAMRSDFKIELENNSLKMGLGWIGNEMSRQ